MRSVLNLRDGLARASRQLHAAGWVANHDGNLSARLGPDRFLCTPTAVSKREVQADWLLVVDGKGQLIEGRRKPFSELDQHLACYRARPEVEIVCHAHPPNATGFGVAGVPLAPLPLPEVIVSLGAEIPTVPLLPPRSPELLAAVAGVAAKADAFLVAGNGAFTLGETVEQALLRMELVEHVAKILLAALPLGGARPLPQALVDELLAARPKR